MKKHACKNSSVPFKPVGEPHFDDERTLLSARPVVPLDQIVKNRKLKSAWFVPVTFALAIFLGGASGLVSAYFKLREVPESRPAQVDGPTQAPPDEALASALPGVILTGETATSLSANFNSPEEQRSRPVTPKRVAKPRTVTQSMNHPLTSQPLSEDEELSRIRRSVLIEEPQGRRMKIAERREGRRPELN
jgi:hypothetical protein